MSTEKSSNRFWKPDQEAFRMIRDMVQSLDVVAHRDTKLRRKKDAACVDTLDTVLSVLNGALDADYTTNLFESKEASWTFEYVLEQQSERPGELDVLTCLFREGEGSIYYGRTVKRIGADLFIVWIDD